MALAAFREIGDRPAEPRPCVSWALCCDAETALAGFVLWIAEQRAAAAAVPVSFIKHLAQADTGLVDIGWTGRMVASLISVRERAGMARPHVLFWGHEPRPTTGWTDPERVGLYVYNTATGRGPGWSSLTSSKSPRPSGCRPQRPR